MLETTAPKPFCFVLMPFNKSFNDIYQLGIKEACNVAGAYCERVDEQPSPFYLHLPTKLPGFAFQIANHSDTLSCLLSAPTKCD